jgi:hypothetical protein
MDSHLLGTLLIIGIGMLIATGIIISTKNRDVLGWMIWS